MSQRKLKLSLKRQSLMTVRRARLQGRRLVYVLVAKKQIPYRYGRSSIVYIGTTQTGIRRVFQSAGEKADQILGGHGIDTFDVRIVTCLPRQNVKTWRKLERALLLTFRAEYGDVPKYNTQGKGIQETDEFTYFARGLRAVVKDLS